MTRELVKNCGISAKTFFKVRESYTTEKRERLCDIADRKYEDPLASHQHPERMSWRFVEKKFFQSLCNFSKKLVLLAQYIQSVF